MITPEEYKKALTIVNLHKEQLNYKMVAIRTCCICKTKRVHPIEPELIDPLKQEQGMWDDGVVEKISFGYGSRHDMDSYYIAICDDCIDNLKDEGLATHVRTLRKEVTELKGEYGIE